MKWFLTFVAITAVLSGGSKVSAVGIPDFNDDESPPLWAWVGLGTFCHLPMVDSDDKYQVHATYHMTVSTNLKDDHCKDSEGTKRPHRHYRDNYPDANDGDAYWDYVFMEGTETTRVEQATNKTNCHSYALATFINKGTYNYWIGDSVGNASHMAMCTDTDSKGKWEVQPNDVLYTTIHLTTIRRELFRYPAPRRRS